MSSYQDLQVWHKAVDLVVAVYRHTHHYPKHELFGLISQTRRAATSVPANIAEGQARKRNPSFRNFLRIARGSLAELETHLEIARRLKYLAEDDARLLLKRADEVGRMIQGLISSLDGEKAEPAADEGQ